MQSLKSPIARTGFAIDLKMTGLQKVTEKSSRNALIMGATN